MTKINWDKARHAGKQTACIEHIGKSPRVKSQVRIDAKERQRLIRAFTKLCVQHGMTLAQARNEAHARPTHVLANLLTMG